MPTPSTNPCPSIALTLRAARDDASGPKITRATVAEALNCSETQAGRWLDGEHDDRFEQLQHAVRDRQLGTTFVNALVCGSEFVAVRRSPSRNMDLDGDGKIELDDLLAAIIELGREVGDKAAAVHDQRGGRFIPREQAMQLVRRVTRIRSWVDDIEATINQLTQQAGPRGLAG